MRSGRGNYKIFVLSLALFLAFFLQNISLSWLGFRLDLILIFLIAFSFVTNFVQLVFLTMLSAFFLNWQPVLSAEIILIVALPLVIFGIKQFIPGRFWVSMSMTALISISGFYVGTAFSRVAENFGVFLEVTFLSVLIGLLLASPFLKIYKQSLDV